MTQFTKNLNAFILSEMKEFFEEFEKKNSDSDISSETLFEELKKYLDTESENTTIVPIKEKEVKLKEVKEKKKRVQKELLPEERCDALKKDSTRCNGKKSLNSTDATMCSLHNRSGAKYGRYLADDIPDGQEASEEPASEDPEEELV